MSPQSVVGLIAAFDDAEADVRNEARRFARGDRAARRAPADPGAARTPTCRFVATSCVTLGKLNTLAVDAVPALQQRLQDADPQVRALAAASLRLIKANRGSDAIAVEFQADVKQYPSESGVRGAALVRRRVVPVSPGRAAARGRRAGQSGPRAEERQASPTTTSTRTSTRPTSASIAARSAPSAPICASRRAT